MLQIIDLENNALFTQVSSEESVSVSGGAITSFAAGSFLALSSGLFFGNQFTQTALAALLVNDTIP
ncbi:MAG: hypothetical protein KAF91_16655 [Nostoc sp. TH1S01]|nr:hypothetical protein [Nostoc sp. TH1S01]MBU7584517.1 hypothetical protein [Nostoc sp. TH1S01]